MAVAKFEPKARPTNRDLQDQIVEVHGCLHNVSGEVEHQGLQMAALAGALGVVLPTKAEIEAGVKPVKIRRKLGGMSPWQVAAIAATIIPGGMAIYKVIEPAVVAFAGALHSALMNLH